MVGINNPYIRTLPGVYIIFCCKNHKLMQKTLKNCFYDKIVKMYLYVWIFL